MKAVRALGEVAGGMFFHDAELEFALPDGGLCGQMVFRLAQRGGILVVILAFFCDVIPVEAQSPPVTPVDAGGIQFTSEWNWPSGYEIGDGGGRDYKITPRLAFRDELYVAPSRAPTFAQSQNTAPIDSGNLPALPPPMNSSDAPDGPALPDSERTEDSGLSMDEPAVEEETPKDAAEEKKEDEKPVIPDFAKALAPLIVDDEKITFVPGVRIQPRYNYDDNFDNNDFFINRFRLKGSGSAYDIAKYGVELKIDGTSRFEASPSAQVENAWLDFPLVDDYAYLRAGLYDLPFSRDALTSDSKLLLMDRSLIKDALTALGLADNTVGLLFHGRPYGGHAEYALGVFDNVAFEKVGAAGTRESDQLMLAGRFALALLEPAPSLDGYADYKGSYLGQSERLDIGFNGAHLGEAIDGLTVFDLSALGADLFYSTGPYTFQTEYDLFVEDIDDAAEIDGHGWYVQGGYLLNPCDPCIELTTRYQVLDSDIVGDVLRWTSFGCNFYIRDHNLKVQTDYTFRDGGLLEEDVFAVQLQLDF